MTARRDPETRSGPRAAGRPWAERDGEDLVVRVKAVPGASRTEIAGALGDHLKIRVHVPPEGGRANRAIAVLIAATCGVEAGRVVLVRGAAQSRKVWRIVDGGAAADAALQDAADA